MAVYNEDEIQDPQPAGMIKPPKKTFRQKADKFAGGLGDVLQMLGGTPLDEIRARKATNQSVMEELDEKTSFSRQFREYLAAKGHTAGSLSATQKMAELEDFMSQAGARKTDTRKFGGMTPQGYAAKNQVAQGERQLANDRRRTQQSGVEPALQMSAYLDSITDPKTGVVNEGAVNRFVSTLKSQGVDTGSIEGQIAQHKQKQAERLKALTAEDATTSKPAGAGFDIGGALKALIPSNRPNFSTTPRKTQFDFLNMGIPPTTPGIGPMGSEMSLEGKQFQDMQQLGAQQRGDPELFKKLLEIAVQGGQQ